jgi:hypothetical protein
VSFDREQWDKDNQARLRSLIADVTIGGAESVDEALYKQGPVPFLGTIYAGRRTPPNETRLVPSNTRQRFIVTLSVVAVTEGWGTREENRAAALKLLQRASDALVTKGRKYNEWQNPQAETPFVHMGEEFVTSVAQRVAYHSWFEAVANDTFNG